MTDREAIERAQFCCFDDLARTWARMCAEQRRETLAGLETSMRAHGFPEHEIRACLVEQGEMLDGLRAEGYARLRAERGRTLDPATMQ